MPVSLTCKCGALLEIDDAFVGKTIRCPDCHKPLATVPLPPEPAQTSSWALASFLLALIGAFTLVGTLAAIVCGAVALRRIHRAPKPLGGKRLAQAGIGLGAGLTLLTLLALWSSDFLKVDGILRAIESAGIIEYTPRDEIPIEVSGGFEARSGTIQRPSPSWGRLTYKDPNKEKTDDLVLVNLWEDAYIVCLSKWIEAGQTLESCRQEGEQRFLQSDLVTKILGHTDAAASPPTGQDRERKQLPGSETQEFLLDLRLAGIQWTFVVRVTREGTRLTVLAGGTRAGRFARLQPDFVKALDSYKMEKQ